MDIYLAGPMRGLPLFNFPAFEEAAGELSRRGHRVWSPAAQDIEEGFDPSTGVGLKTLRAYMQADLVQVLDADAVVVLPGWEKSQGASLEVHVARECGIPVLAYPSLEPIGGGAPRTFATGATRDSEDGKPDYEGFFSPIVLRERAAYMHRHRVQSDGRLRDSDNWQRGIPASVYMKSGFRHFLDWWELHRARDGGPQDEMREALCALMFNAEGYLHELLEEDA